MPRAPAALEEQLRDFTGRGWVFDRVDQWLADGSARRLLITGGPGIGKSSLAARLVQFSEGLPSNRPNLGEGWLAASHFCRAQVDTSLDPRRVFEHLALQLAERSPTFRAALLNSPEVGSNLSIEGTVSGTAESMTAVSIGRIDLAGRSARETFDRFLRQPLEALCAADDAPVILLIDSLDEALTYGSEQNLVDVLRKATDDPEELPDQVRFLWTSRHDSRATDGMADLVIDLEADAPPDDADVLDYATRRLASIDQPEDRRIWAAGQVADSADGNFLYARYVLDDLLAHPDRLARPGPLDLPDDLADHYRAFLERELAANKERWETSFRPVLGALAVARGDGLTREQLADALDLRGSEIDSVLGVVAGYLSGERLRLYHQSFRDFLFEKGDYYVYPGEASDCLATCFLDEHAGAWLEADDAYAVAYTPSHLIEALQLAETRKDRERAVAGIERTLTDLGYLTARVVADGGRLVELERDYGQAVSATLPDRSKAVLTSFVEALRSESHVLAARPHDLFAQLVNRLPDLPLDSEARPRGPWLRAVHPLPFERALRRTLTRFLVSPGEDVSIEGVAVSADGSRAVSVGMDRSIAVWDLAEFRLVRAWDAGTDMLEEVSLAPDGSRLVCRDFAGVVELWDLDSGTKLHDWRGAAYCVSPTWDRLFLAHDDGTVAEVGLPDLETRATHAVGGTVSTMVATSDGRWLVMDGGEQRRVMVRPIDGSDDGYQLDCPLPEQTSAGEFESEVIETIALSEDDATLVAGGSAGSLWAWSFPERQVLWWCKADSLILRALAVTSKRGLVVAAGAGGTIGVYDAATGTELSVLRGHTGQVMDLALTDDGGTLVSGGGEGAVRIWDLQTQQREMAGAGHRGAITALGVSDDGALAATGADDGSLLVWSVASGDVVASRAAAHQGPVRGVSFVTEHRLVSVGEEKLVRVWDPADLAEPLEIPLPEQDDEDPVIGIGYQSVVPLRQSVVLVGADDGRLIEIDLDSSELVNLGVVESDVVALGVTKDGTTVTAGCLFGTIHRIDRGGEAAHVMEIGVDEIDSFVVHSDERHVFVGDLNGAIHRVAIDGSADQLVIGQHVNYVKALALAGEASALVAGGWDATIRIWPVEVDSADDIVELGRYTWTLPLERAATAHAADGEVVVLGDRQGQVLFLSLEN